MPGPYLSDAANLSGFRDARHERSRSRGQNPADSRQSLYEDGSDFTSTEVASDQDEHPCLAGPQRGQFERPIPQALIFGQDYPPTGPDVSKPHPVLRIAVKMVVVDLNPETGVNECRSDRLYAQRSIDAVDRSFRRLRSGWLLRLKGLMSMIPATWNRLPHSVA